MEYNFYKTNKELKKQSFETLSGVWKTASGTSFLFIFLSLILALLCVLTYIFTKSILFTILVSLVSAFLIYILSYGWKNYCWNLAVGNKVKTSLLFSGFEKPFLKLVGLMFKKFFLLLMWLFVFIFPAFYKWFNYDMASYIIMDNNNQVKNPITQSIHILKLNVWRLIGFYFSFFGWFVLSLLTAGIGFIWLLPYFSTAKAYFYENLKTDF